MNISPRFLAQSGVRLGLATLLLVGGLAATHGADIKLDAQLVWGTNDEKSPDPAHKPVDAALAKKLGGLPFKWKNYFVINRRVFTVNDKDYTTNEMSRKCTIAVKDAGNSRIKVKMSGDGKEWHKQERPLLKGETLIIAGDDKNQSAWMVVLRHADMKAPETTQPQIKIKTTAPLPEAKPKTDGK